MKVSKLFTAVVVASAMFATVADAGSIGRSGGGGGRSSSSFSSGSSMSRSSSFSQPSKPAVAPAPATRPGGIGGANAGSALGVRKSEVTAPVAQQVRPATPSTPSGSSYSGSHPTTSPGYSAPHYSAPAPVVVHSGGGFGSTFAGAMAGSMVGNALFGNHGNGGGTTVINNGTPGGGGYSQGPAPAAQGGGYVDNGVVGQSGQVVVQQKEGTGMGSIIVNVILFAILIALLVGIAILFYKGFKMLKEYINKERGVSNQPFSPTARFWEIQRAFAAADIGFLKTLLGPDLVDEATNGLEASTLSLSGVSHEVRLNNNTEFSVWYTFTDAGETINQVWHYEKFGKDWLLNGIETV